MKILFDIGHPAHVHYFRNFNEIMKKNGHSTFFVARDKEVTIDLLKNYNIEFICRGKGAKSLLGKLLYLIRANLIIFKTTLKFNPDIFMSFASPYAAHVAWIMRKPHISFTDTEHATLGKLAFVPFTTNILTPTCFNIDLGNKQICFNSYMELCYLHPNYFKPDKSVLNLLSVKQNEKFIILRFVSWDASHDVGQHGLNLESKVKLVRELSKSVKVFISSETILPVELEKYKINIPPEKMHDVLFYSSLFIGEGATMTSECAMLGTPAIYVNTLNLGYINELESQFGLVYKFGNSTGVLNKATELLKMSDLKNIYNLKRKKMLSEKIDGTAFLVWFIENYPKSVELIKENPNLQYEFK